MDDFNKPKIVYPNMTKYLPFVYDEKQHLTNQKCFIITGENVAFLTAFFNSSLFKFCFRDSFPELQGGTRELSKIFLYKSQQFEFILIRRQRLISHFICSHLIKCDFFYLIFHLYHAEILRPELVYLSTKNMLQIIFALNQKMLLSFVNINHTHNSQLVGVHRQGHYIILAGSGTPIVRCTMRITARQLRSRFIHILVRLHIYRMEIYGVRTKDKVVELRYGDVLFHRICYFCCANCNQRLLLKSNFTPRGSPVALSCSTIIKPLRAILYAPLASAS